MQNKKQHGVLFDVLFCFVCALTICGSTELLRNERPNHSKISDCTFTSKKKVCVLLLFEVTIHFNEFNFQSRLQLLRKVQDRGINV